MNGKNKSVVALRAPFVAALTLSAGSASAWLGGFEAVDGYQPFLNRVQEYNAGQYGANSGYAASSPVAITANTGLWTAVSGGFSSGGSTSYATGHQWYDRQWVNDGIGSDANLALVLTTGHEGWTGPALEYRYSLDSQDLGGTSPGATGNSIITMSFWWCAQLAGPEVGGSIADGYFGDEIQFRDSSGNIGFSLGLTQRAGGDTVTYWDGTSMNESSIVASSSKYDRWDITLNTDAGTVSASYFHFPTSTSTTLISNVSMMSLMADFSELSFRTSPGVTNAKLMSVDDFGFEVQRIPTPATVVVLGALGLRRRRR